MFGRMLMFVASGLIWPVAVTADYNDALSAQSRGDYESAAKAWKHLATSGDPVAQYNLAMLYQSGQGVKSDPNTAQQWFAKAARQGLTEAYQQLNQKSVQPVTGGGATRTLVVTPLIQNDDTRVSAALAWLAKQDQENYTVQLVSSTNEDIIKEYFINYKLDGKAGYFKSRKQGQNWYTLVYGSFDTVADANVAITELPDDLKKWSPWIRNVSEVQRLIR